MTVSRISRRFAELRARGRSAFIPFVEAFDPDRPTSLALLRALPAAGADLIEVGVPFSDPMADGPIIQAAGQRALRAGATLAGVLDLVADFRAGDTATPVILMGYLNPLMSFGIESFCRRAAAAGVDGLIVVDLPPEEQDLLLPAARRAGLDFIRLIAPTTSDARLPAVLEGSSGFVYYISITGITGTRSASRDELAREIPRLRRATRLPIAVGFGVKTPEQAAVVAELADGAVVASALIDLMAGTLDEAGRPTAATLPRVLEAAQALAGAVHAVPHPPSPSPDP